LGRDVAEISALLGTGRAAEAAALARRFCEEDPLAVDAWYLQAAAHAQTGDWIEVVRCCRAVLDLVPGHVETHTNLAAALGRLGRFPEAAASFARVLELDPGCAEARQGLAATQHALGCAALRDGRADEATARFEAAIGLDPGLADAHGRLGAIAAASGRWEQAIGHFERLLQLQPSHLSGLVNYGAALRAAGRADAAAAVYRRTLALHPESALARYFAATVGAEQAPPQAPRTYVQELFDSYAGRFDDHLVRQLQYRIPEVMAATLRALVGAPPAPLRILDLGCGTGLAGAAVRSMASQLVGIDLSPAMIEAARQKNVYDELHVAEIGEFLDQASSAWDVILATDVFIYVGDIARIVTRATELLARNGLLAFSVELAETDTAYELRDSGRYAHSLSYVRELAQAAGLQELRADPQVVRTEAGAAIGGMLFVFRAAGRSPAINP
jgi:predicted TPR repeat methyltransferase